MRVILIVSILVRSVVSFVLAFTSRIEADQTRHSVLILLWKLVTALVYGRFARSTLRTNCRRRTNRANRHRLNITQHHLTLIESGGRRTKEERSGGEGAFFFCLFVRILYLSFLMAIRIITIILHISTILHPSDFVRVCDAMRKCFLFLPFVESDSMDLSSCVRSTGQ